VPGGGCSAGRCACPCSRSTLPVDGTDRGRAAGLLNVLWTERAGPRWCSAVCAPGHKPSADTVPTRVRSAVRGGQTAPAQPIDPISCHAEWRTPPSPSPHRILRHRGGL
jgi:hypothetical protein